MLLLVNMPKKQKKTYSIKKESNKFSNQLTQPKEIDIKNKAIEATKNIKREAKAQELNQLKNTHGNKKLHG